MQLQHCSNGDRIFYFSLHYQVKYFFKSNFSYNKRLCFFRLCLMLRQISCKIYYCDFIRNRIGKLHVQQLIPTQSFKPCFFKKLTMCCFQRRLMFSATAFGYFPTVIICGKPVLPDYPCIIIFIQRDNPYRSILKRYLTIYSFPATGVDHIIFRKLYPGIIINIPLPCDLPGILFFIQHIAKIKPAGSDPAGYSYVLYKTADSPVLPILVVIQATAISARRLFLLLLLYPAFPR